MENTQIKEVVKKAYTEVLNDRSSGCCSDSCCGEESMADDYTKQEGYIAEADYGLGCGIPTELAAIKEGDIVLDLGSGAGNDVFIASKTVGDKGKVIGLDMTAAMIQKANDNKSKLGFKNVEFILGDIENIPIENDKVDVVISNCVLNLVPDKAKAFNEIYRVLRSGGHFTISDIIYSGNMPDSIKSVAEMYAGCISGAVEKKSYLETIVRSGFTSVTIHKEKIIDVPDTVLRKHITEAELLNYREGGGKIISITLSGTK